MRCLKIFATQKFLLEREQSTIEKQSKLLIKNFFHCLKISI